jgi:heat shock protein HslJ
MRTVKGVLALTLIIGVPTLLAACGSASDAGDPTGVEWTLKEGSGDTDMTRVGITARFEDGQLSGFSGVNQYSGPYTIDESGSFEAGPFAATLMAGPEPLMKAEQAYLKLLEGCDSYSVKNGTLTLSTDGEDTLVYEESPAAELPGSAWTVTGYNNGKGAVQSVSADATLTVIFGTDGTVAGNAGVNTYTGPFESSEDTVEIGPLASTKMAGPEALMTQEALFLAALQNATRWSVQQGRLEMRDESGAMQVTCIGALE